MVAASPTLPFGPAAGGGTEPGLRNALDGVARARAFLGVSWRSRCHYPIFPRRPDSGCGYDANRRRYCAEGALATNFPQKVLPVLAPSRTEPTAQDASPWLIRRNRPTRRTADTRRRRSDPFVTHPGPHPEASAGRSRPIRSRSAAKSWRGAAASASWNTTYFACITTLAPILTRFSRKVVRVQLRIDRGSAVPTAPKTRTALRMAGHCRRTEGGG